MIAPVVQLEVQAAQAWHVQLACDLLEGVVQRCARCRGGLMCLLRVLQVLRSHADLHLRRQPPAQAQEHARLRACLMPAARPPTAFMQLMMRACTPALAASSRVCLAQGQAPGSLPRATLARGPLCAKTHEVSRCWLTGG